MSEAMNRNDGNRNRTGDSRTIRETKKAQATQASNRTDNWPIPLRPFHTVEQVAEILQVTERQTYRYLKTGALAAYKFGRLWRIRHEDLMDFINNRRR